MLANRLLASTAAAFASAAACAQPQPTFPALPYATLGPRSLLLDLYIPAAGPGPFPCVVFIHGGGWSGGSRTPVPAPALATRLLNAGLAIASIDYRLTSQAGQFGTNPVTFPAQIHDTKGAVRFLRANAAQFNLNPARFGSWGSSAGGHLSALLGASGGVASLEGTVGGNLGQSSAVQAVADYFGPTDLLNASPDVTTPPGSTVNHDAPTSAESALIGFNQPGQGIGVLRANQNNPNPPFPQFVTLVTQANPMTWVDPVDPPFLIAHGELDTVVPQKQSIKLHDALRAAGGTSTYWVMPSAGHGFGGAEIEAEVTRFFQMHLLGVPFPPRCAANCDGSTAAPVLNINDFQCFINRFAANQPSANCDASTLVPVLNVNDFSCFLNRFATGCP
ncbi:MAG: prolyl oligopeptidase family serine peptidase [Phycisphaerales bacterium]